MAQRMPSQKLAKYGRFGDTEMRKVDGETSHVNLLEAYMIDRFGEKGEDWVQEKGAGTINPVTGQREHFFDPVSITAYVAVGSAIWGGIQSWKERDKAKEKAETASGVLDTGFEDLGGQMEGYLGGGVDDPNTPDIDESKGFLEQEYDITTEGLQADRDYTMGTLKSDFDYTTGTLKSGRRAARSDYGYTAGTLGQQVQTGMQDIAQSEDIATSQAGLATSGTLQKQTRQQESRALGTYGLGMKKAQSGWKEAERSYGLGMEKATSDYSLGREKAISDYDIGMDTASLTQREGRADFLAGIQDKMNDMVMNYQSSTGEAYEESTAYKDLEKLLADYA